MATYGKPTTSFYINYGTLDPGVAQRALAPALLAPRYRLHRTSAGFAGTALEIVADDGTVQTWPEITKFSWPDRQESDSVIDISSAKLIAKNMYLIMNSTALAGTVGADALNYITTTETGVKGANKSALLGGYDVRPGDRVEIKAGSVIENATVVDILPTMTKPSSSITDATGSATDKLAVSNYTGKEDSAYLVVVKGKDTNGVVTLNITALAGDLGYANTCVLAADGEVSVGDYGIKLTAGTSFADILEGDSFIISGTAAAVEFYNNIYLDIELSELANGAEIEVTFSSCVLSPAEATLSGAAWSVSGDEITIAEQLPSISLGGTSYGIASAELHMQYRELLTSDLLELKSSQTTGIAEWVGPADPENPMGMMYAAASVVDGTFFYLLATGNDTESTIQAINYVGQFEGAYAPIPFLQTKETQNAVVAMIAKYSNPQIAQFKHTWFCSTSGRESIVYSTDEDNNSLIGEVTDNVLTLKGASANLVKHQIKAGDYAMIVGGYDSDTGKFDETAYRIKRVKSDTQAELENAANCGISRVYVKRVLSGSEYAEKLAAEASSWNSIRVNFVGSDKVSFGGFDDVNPVYLCVTLASMRCALPPHAPMNELVVPGYQINDEMKWTDSDYEKMNNGGVWVVARNTEGDVVTYHQITTRTDGTIAEEDNVVSNGDSIVRQLRLAVRPYASGKSNVTESLISTLRGVLTAEIAGIRGESYGVTYGSRILNYNIDRLYIPEGNKRSIVCECNLELPQPMQDGRFVFNLF